MEFYNLSKEQREELGKKGRAHVTKNYNFEDYHKRWLDLLLDVYENRGSWDTRKQYSRWEMSEIV